MPSQVNSFIKRLNSCPGGKAGWQEFEQLCVEILDYLFIPALKFNSRQPRTFSGINRMDAIYANRNLSPNNDPEARNWYHLFIELGARLILFEFKNYAKTEIGQDEVNQTRNYLSLPMGRLAIMICNKKPNGSAHKQRNVVYNQEKKVILFLTKEELKEMLFMKDRGEQPSDLLIDLLESFYIQHE